jgi:hypothetical protein
MPFLSDAEREKIEGGNLIALVEEAQSTEKTANL